MPLLEVKGVAVLPKILLCEWVIEIEGYRGRVRPNYTIKQICYRQIFKINIFLIFDSTVVFFIPCSYPILYEKTLR